MNIKSKKKQKVLLALYAGVALGFSRSPKNYFKILEGVSKEWKEIDKKFLVRTVREFYIDRVVDYREKKDGVVEIILTKQGAKRALKYQIDEMKVKKPKKWDEKWRIVIFDIPEKKKKAREAMRNKLRDLGFRELQKSVFVLPYECKDEIDFVVEVFNIRQHVVFMETTSFTNEEKFRLKFKLY